MSALREIWLVREIVLPLLDVLLLSVLIYRGYQVLVRSRAVQIVRGALVFAALYAVSFFLDLRTVLWLINLLAPSLVIAIAIVFQPELRKIFTRIGQGRFLSLRNSTAPRLLDAIAATVEVLGQRRRGALIVLARSVSQKSIVETGTQLDAEPSAALLLTIFSHDTELHDGAVVIENERVTAAGCFLPLSEQTDVRRSFGTRHRAALGLSEESDAVVVIVSEETGAVSLAYDAALAYDLNVSEIREHLSELLGASLELDGEPREEVTELGD